MAPRLDLKKANAVAFSFVAACEVNHAIRTEIERLLKRNLEDGMSLAFGVAYIKGGNESADVAFAEYSELEKPHLHASFSYGIEDLVARPPRGVYKPYTLLKIMSLSDKAMEFSCRASFIYENSATRSTIQLPIPIFRTEQFGFQEIQGLRLSCREPGESSYHIEMSVEEDGSLCHEVVFKYEGGAKPGIEAIFLKNAVRISHQFLR